MKPGHRVFFRALRPIIEGASAFRRRPGVLPLAGAAVVAMAAAFALGVGFILLVAFVAKTVGAPLPILLGAFFAAIVVHAAGWFWFVALASTFVGSAIAAATLDADGHGAGRRGLALAWRRRRRIVAWATVATFLPRHVEFGDSPAAAVVEFAAAMSGRVALFLVVPAIVFEDARPSAAIASSVRRMRLVWAEEVAGLIGLGGLVALGLFGSILVAFWPPALLGVRGVVSTPIALAIFGTMLAGFAATASVALAVRSVLSARVYALATAAERGQDEIAFEVVG